MKNCFNGGGVPGKLQTGSAWWFADHRDGIEEQLRAISNQGMLSTYVGMTADSRSLLSMSRHDYFRRILCNLLGKWVEDREIPSNELLLGDWYRIFVIIMQYAISNLKKFIRRLIPGWTIKRI